MEPKKHLPINLETFGFVQRELVDGKKLLNQCGRDFLYYVLHYYFPEKFNQENLNPREIKEKGIFGMRGVPVWLIWTGRSFNKIPKLFSSLKLSFSINGRKIENYFHFFIAMLPLKVCSFEKSIEVAEKAIDQGKVAGIDISIRLGGLVDHVMFVYGYDNENFYVFDTNQVSGLEYVKLTPEEDNRFIMKLPKSVIKKRWTIFNRVWTISKYDLHTHEKTH